MDLTKDDVIKVADNARLHVSEDEIETYTKQINHMLHYVKKIQEINTDNVEPTTHGNTITDVLRKDDAVQWGERDKALENASDSAEGHFKVPSVLD